MDRNETIELSRLAAFDKVPIPKALKAITDYCLERVNQILASQY